MRERECRTTVRLINHIVYPWPDAAPRGRGIHALQLPLRALAVITWLALCFSFQRKYDTHLHVRSGELAGGLWHAILRLRQKKHARVSGFFGLSSINDEGRGMGGGAGMLGIDSTRWCGGKDISSEGQVLL